MIFVDEVDSMLGRRESHGEHEAMRKMKNEFRLNWDGLRTKDKERVLVLAATNRPFDLDEAVIRRLSRRLMANFPDTTNREKNIEHDTCKRGIDTRCEFRRNCKYDRGPVHILHLVGEDRGDYFDIDLHEFCIKRWQ